MICFYSIFSENSKISRERAYNNEEAISYLLEELPSEDDVSTDIESLHSWVLNKTLALVTVMLGIYLIM